MDKAKAVKEVIASMEMEGFVFTEEELAIFEKIEKGEMSSDDLRRLAEAKIAKWKKESPETFSEGN